MSELSSARLGIIGAGGIGKTHLRAWAANGITPAAIADANPTVLAAAVEAHGGEPFADGESLIRSGLVDIACICTPPAFHADLAVTALEAGLAVFCEKPLATTVADAERVQAAVERSGAMFAVGFCHRFQPQVERLREMIAEGDLGVIREFRNRFAGHLTNAETRWFSNPAMSGGGALIDTSVHSVDLFRYLVGEPVGVQAFTSTCESDLGPALEVEDTGVIILKTADGALGVIETSWRTPPGEWVLSVHGTGGTATLDYATLALRFCRGDGEWEDVAVEPGDRFEREIAQFIDCWRNGGTPRATVDDGVAATRILDAAYRSAGPAGRLAGWPAGRSHGCGD
jgi:predicted dehydrogenase